jgi:ligand-binding sensor protein
MSIYSLSELLDMTLVQKLAESNYRASGLPMSIIDAFDTSILVSAGWQDICTQFHRVNPLSRARCLESDNRARDHADSRVPYQYKCENGIWHIATPIVAAGHHLATMFLTQFNFEGEGPDREFFIRQAHELGYNLDSYLNALDRMPTFSSEKVDYILAYDMALAQFIANSAEQSLRIVEAKKSLSKN